MKTGYFPRRQSPAHRPFAFVWSGQTVSRLGNNLYKIALAGGVAVDRLSRTRILLWADGLRGVIATAVANLTWAVILQQRVEPGLLGRVGSINLLGATGLLPIGFWLAGAATDAFGPAWVFVIGGALSAAGAANGPLVRDVRRI